MAMVSSTLLSLHALIGCQKDPAVQGYQDTAQQESQQDSWPALPATAVEEGVPLWSLEDLSDILAMVQETGFPSARQAL